MQNDESTDKTLALRNKDKMLLFLSRRNAMI